MRTLAIDVEGFCSVDLPSSGGYAYAESDDFEIMLFGYAWDDEPVQVVDLARGEPMPDDVMSALTDPNVLKTAWNANFERTCISRFFEIELPSYQWACSMVHAYYLGLPGSLEKAAQVLKIKQQKDTKGKALIRYFSIPCRPTKANGGRTRNLPSHDTERWQQFIEYNRQDVEVERAIRKKLLRYKMPEKEQKLWQLDQKINDRGICLDAELVQNAIELDFLYQKKLFTEAKRITGLENPNSVAQLKQWLENTEGLEIESLNKNKVSELIKQTNNPAVKRVLELRQEMSKTSVKKYQAMKRALCSDNRVHGLLQYYGANRTGRWAGRLVQVQNLPRNEMSDLDLARQLLKAEEFDLIELLFESVPDVLSQLIRTAFIPSPGCRFIVSDFSAIEARVIAWLAGEQWRLDVFNSHGKIYEASASQMFGVPIEKITKGSDLRQKGKVAELALGYQGSVGALKSMGALQMGLSEDELPDLVSSWRDANPNIVQLWWGVGNAAMKTVREKRTVEMQHGLTFSYEAGALFIRLPSGRKLTYPQPKIKLDERFNRYGLTYMDVELGKWKRIKTYGGKLVENIVQATARDCLAESLLKLDEAGYDIAFHVHDEVVLDMPHGSGSLEEVEEIMSQPLPWAPGLPLNADGFETDYYMKD